MLMRSTPALALMLVCAPAAVSAQAGKDPAIIKVADAYVKASLARDAKAVSALYAENAIEMPPNQPPVKGRAAIEEHYRKLFADPDMKMERFTLDHIESSAHGDAGHDVGTYSQTLTVQGKSMNETGKYVVILKRTGGEWKVVYAIYNSDQAPMAMPSPGPRP